MYIVICVDMHVYCHVCGHVHRHMCGHVKIEACVACYFYTVTEGRTVQPRKETMVLSYSEVKQKM